MALGEIADQSGSVGVVATPLPARPARQRVYRSGTRGEFRAFRTEACGDLFQRQRDVRATPARGGELTELRRERLRRRIDGYIVHRYAELPPKQRVDARRQRV